MIRRFFQIYLRLWVILFVASTVLIWINVFVGLPNVFQIFIFIWRSFIDAVVYRIVGPHQPLWIYDQFAGVIVDAATAAIFAFIGAMIVMLIRRRNLIWKWLISVGILGSLAGFAFYFFRISPEQETMEDIYGAKPWIEVRFYYEFPLSKNYAYSGIESASACELTDRECVFNICEKLAAKTAALYHRSVSDGNWLCGIEPLFSFGDTTYEYMLYSDDFPTDLIEGTNVRVR